MAIFEQSMKSILLALFTVFKEEVLIFGDSNMEVDDCDISNFIN